MGRSPIPRLRNFFEKKFLKNLQKTLKKSSPVRVVPSLRRCRVTLTLSQLSIFHFQFSIEKAHSFAVSDCCALFFTLARQRFSLSGRIFSFLWYYYIIFFSVCQQFFSAALKVNKLKSGQTY